MTVEMAPVLANAKHTRLDGKGRVGELQNGWSILDGYARKSDPKTFENVWAGKKVRKQKRIGNQTDKGGTQEDRGLERIVNDIKTPRPISQQKEDWEKGGATGKGGAVDRFNEEKRSPRGQNAV